MTSVDPSSLIADGDKIILKKNKNIQCAVVTKSKKIHIDNLWFTLNNAIGKPYGSTFEVKGNKVHWVKPEEAQPEEEHVTPNLDAGADNRHFTDSSDNQKLTHQDVEELRRKGVHGEELIGQIVEGSATFKDKTEYAQRKYLARKGKKHMRRFVVMRPSTRLVAEMYFNKGPGKICNLRMDTLAQMLTLCNVQANNKMLVYDSCVGLLVGAVLERMAGYGKLLHIHSGLDPVISAVDMYNFSPKCFDSLHSLSTNDVKWLTRPKPETTKVEASTNSDEPPVKRLKADDSEVKDHQKTDDAKSQNDDGASTTEIKIQPCDSNTKDKEESNGNADMECEGNKTSDSKPDDTDSSKASDTTQDVYDTRPQWLVIKEQEYQARRVKREQRKAESKQILVEGEFDGLLMAGKFFPTPILMDLIGYLALSRPFAVFCLHQQPLIDCYQKLRDRRGIVNLRLTETWCREYQVLPNRTHPAIKFDNCSGYLLTGMTCGTDAKPT